MGGNFDLKGLELRAVVDPTWVIEPSKKFDVYGYCAILVPTNFNKVERSY